MRLIVTNVTLQVEWNKWGWMSVQKNNNSRSSSSSTNLAVSSTKIDYQCEGKLLRRKGAQQGNARLCLHLIYVRNAWVIRISLRAICHLCIHLWWVRMQCFGLQFVRFTVASWPNNFDKYWANLGTFSRRRLGDNFFRKRQNHLRESASWEKCQGSFCLWIVKIGFWRHNMIMTKRTIELLFSPKRNNLWQIRSLRDPHEWVPLFARTKKDGPLPLETFSSV